MGRKKNTGKCVCVCFQVPQNVQQILITDPKGVAVYMHAEYPSEEIGRKHVHEVLEVRPTTVVKFHKLKKIKFYQLTQELGYICDYHPTGKNVFEKFDNFDHDGVPFFFSFLISFFQLFFRL